MSTRIAGLTAERGAELAREEVARGWRDHGPATTGADLAAALANDSADHWEGIASSPARDWLGDACGHYSAAAIMGYETARPAIIAARLERQWTARQRSRGARGRIDGAEILRRCEIAARSIGAISDDERDALTGELARSVGRRIGWTPESREVPISRLAQWAADLAARTAEKVARRSDVDTGRDSWRDTADRRAIYTDSPASADEDGESVGQVGALAALRSDPWTAARIRRDAATSDDLADGMSLTGPARDALRAALAGWDIATLAADADLTLANARQRISRGRAAILAAYPSPDDLAAALLAAERLAADLAGSDGLDTDRDPMDGPLLPAAAYAASDAVDRADRALSGCGGDTARRDRAVIYGRAVRRMRSAANARAQWPVSFRRATIGTAPQPMPYGPGEKVSATDRAQWLGTDPAAIAAAVADAQVREQRLADLAAMLAATTARAAAAAARMAGSVTA